MTPARVGEDPYYPRSSVSDALLRRVWGALQGLVAKAVEGPQWILLPVSCFPRRLFAPPKTLVGNLT